MPPYGASKPSLTQKPRPLDIAGFLKLVIDTLEAAGVDYLIGGAIAEWAWDKPRATQDLDLVVKIPIKAINKLSKELEKRDMLIAAEIILNTNVKDRADIPINAIHMHSRLKADLYPAREGDQLRLGVFQLREQVNYGPPIGKVYIHSPEDLILYKLAILWAHPAIETFPRHHSHSQIKET